MPCHLSLRAWRLPWRPFPPVSPLLSRAPCLQPSMPLLPPSLPRVFQPLPGRLSLPVFLPLVLFLPSLYHPPSVSFPISPGRFAYPFPSSVHLLRPPALTCLRERRALSPSQGRSILIRAAPFFLRSAAGSVLMRPTRFTSLAGTGSSPRLKGVGPKKRARAEPGGQ